MLLPQQVHQHQDHRHHRFHHREVVVGEGVQPRVHQILHVIVELQLVQHTVPVTVEDRPVADSSLPARLRLGSHNIWLQCEPLIYLITPLFT